MPNYIPDVDNFNQRVTVGYESTGTPNPPLTDPIAVNYRLPSLPVQGRGGQASTAIQHTRTVDPGYGYWNTHQPFLGQGYYNAVPNGVDAPVTGPGTPNRHGTALAAGVNTSLAQYNPDPYTYSAAYVGALVPQVIPVGSGGIQA